MEIGLDIDGILAATDKATLAALSRHYGVELRFADWHSWFMSACWPQYADIDAQAQTLFDDPAFMAAVPPLPGAVDGATALSRLGEIHYITSRPDHLAPCVAEWLARHGFPAGQTHIGRAKKADLAASIGLAFHVEDAAHHATAVAEVCPVYLFDYPWNQDVSHPRIIRVTGWPKVLERVEATYARAAAV